ncbi:DUF4347 domain-containing protein, partial [Rhodoferax sp.]|uniref:DUF4347 domain-containing protein n=1 Tax=Rhodoferax sp. TaxID=50421 RepID=UPI00283E1C51
MNRIFRIVWNEATRTYVAVAECVRGRSKSSSKSCQDDTKKAKGNNHRTIQRARPRPLALEARLMFDGAAATTLVDTAHDTSTAHAAADAAAKTLIPVAPAPVQVRAGDPTLDNGKKEVVFIETSLAQYKTLEADIRAGVEIEEIDGSQSGLAQIAKWAESHSGYDAIHLLSHGSQATLNLGSDTVTSASLSTPVVQAELAELGHALKPGGDLLLYGCDVAKGADGDAFVSALAQATGADIAASNDSTGSAAHGGNWILEVSTGAIVVDPVLSSTTSSDFDGLLAASVANFTAQPKVTVQTASASGGNPGSTVLGNAYLSNGNTVVMYAGTNVTVSHPYSSMPSYTNSTKSLNGPIQFAVVTPSGVVTHKTIDVAGATSAQIVSLTGGGFVVELNGSSIEIFDNSGTKTVNNTGITGGGLFSLANGGFATAGSKISLYSATGTLVSSNSIPSLPQVTGYSASGVLNGSNYSVSFGSEVVDGLGNVMVIGNATNTVFDHNVYEIVSSSGTKLSSGSLASVQGGTTIPVGLSTGGFLLMESVPYAGWNTQYGYNQGFNIDGQLFSAAGAKVGSEIALLRYSTTYSAPGGGWAVQLTSGNVFVDIPTYGAADLGFYVNTTTLSTAVTHPLTLGSGDHISTNPLSYLYGGEVPLVADGTGGVIGGIDNTSDSSGSGILYVQDFTVGAVNIAPTFIGGSTSLTVVHDSGAIDLIPNLHVSDSDSAQTETWTPSVAPTHGTLSFSGATKASGSTDITPGGTITYTPTTGFAGTDTFTVQVSDGTSTATRTFTVTVDSPTISSATYDATSGVLAVTGTNMNTGNTIAVNKLTLAGEGGSTYTLTSGDVTASSATAFSVTLNAADQAALNQILNKAGTNSSGGSAFNLAGATNWDGSITTTAADATNAVTVSNVAVPAITSSTYDASTGSLVVTGTGFLKLNGAANDIVANKLTFTAEGGATYTLTDTANVEVTSGTAFTL